MTHDQIQRLRDLAALATPGPWVAGVCTVSTLSGPYVACLVDQSPAGAEYEAFERDLLD